jgi:glutamate dehydrogenase/leucine dehydrogenase
VVTATYTTVSDATIDSGITGIKQIDGYGTVRESITTGNSYSSGIGYKTGEYTTVSRFDAAGTITDTVTTGINHKLNDRTIVLSTYTTESHSDKHQIDDGVGNPALMQIDGFGNTCQSKTVTVKASGHTTTAVSDYSAYGDLIHTMNYRGASTAATNRTSEIFSRDDSTNDYAYQYGEDGITVTSTSVYFYEDTLNRASPTGNKYRLKQINGPRGCLRHLRRRS